MAAIFGDFRKIFFNYGKSTNLLQILLNRARSSDFDEIALSRTVKEYLKQICVLAIFGKNFRKFPKMAAIFGEFSKFFAKIGKTQICFYLLNLARYPDFVENFDPQGI